MPEENVTRIFRSIHLPHRRREAENAVDGAPINVQPGELIYDYEQNKLYAGQDDNSALAITSGGGGGPANAIVSDISGISGASAILNIVKISQDDYDNLSTKDAGTLYVIDNSIMPISYLIEE